MYEVHPNFVTPDDNAVIWRYLDLPKFIALIDSRALWFTQARQFKDPYEGIYSNPSRVAVEAELRRHLKPELVEVALRKLEQTRALMPLTTFINCWHQSAHESAAMWQLYSAGGHGLAIRSTVGHLKESVLDRRPFYIGAVQYADYDTVQMQQGNMFVPFLYKRLSFEYEREVRAITADFPIDQVDWTKYAGERPSGIALETDVMRLVERVFVDPTSESWFVSVVESVFLECTDLKSRSPNRTCIRGRSRQWALGGPRPLVQLLRIMARAGQQPPWLLSWLLACSSWKADLTV